MGRLSTELCSGCVCWGTERQHKGTRCCNSVKPLGFGVFLLTSDAAEFWELVFSQPLASPSQRFPTFFAIALQEAKRRLLREQSAGGAGQHHGEAGLGSSGLVGSAAQGPAQHPKGRCQRTPEIRAP